MTSSLNKFKKITHIVHIKETPKNTILNLTDLLGNCLTWQSNGSSSFKGVRKNTAVACKTSGRLFSQKVKALGVKFVDVQFKGWGRFRKDTIVGLLHHGLRIRGLIENNRLPHNGCRQKKRKRIRRKRHKTYWFK